MFRRWPGYSSYARIKALRIRPNKKRKRMNWAEMKRGWSELKAVAQSQWPRLTDVLLRDVNGDRAELARALQRHYGFSAADAETAICEFEKDVRRPGAVK